MKYIDNIINANVFSTNYPDAGSWSYVTIRGVIKKFMDWHSTILVTQSILLIFALALITHVYLAFQISS